MDAVVGKDEVDVLIAASRVNASSRAIGKEETLSPRLLGSSTGLKFYAAPIPWINARFLSASYGSGMLRPFLKGIAKDVGDEQYAKNFSRMVGGVLGGRTGLMALANQSRNDPEFSDQMQRLMADIAARQEAEAQEE